MEESRVPLLQANFPPSSPRERSIAVEDPIRRPYAVDRELPPSASRGEWSSSQTTPSMSNSANPDPRLVSLDVFRGLTVALMILVDDAGGAFPSINHSPWFGVTLADFVMPFFLFGVGVSIGLVFKKVSSKRRATTKVLMRTIKLFLWGLLLQGGYFHGRNNFTYGVDLSRIRFMGVLQRISIGYFLAAISEIWLISHVSVDSLIAFVKKYYIEWLAAILLSSVYLALLYGLYVPNWEFDALSMNSTLTMAENGSKVQIVQCEMKGSLQPPCNAVGLVDRFFLGEKHLYQHPVYRRTKECSVNSPDYGPLPPNSPLWCLAPFDPEGLLSSLMSAVTCFIGLHFGHIIVHCKDHWLRLLLWSSSSLSLLLSGCVMELLGMPLSKPLYTLSYMCITAGVAGFLLTIIYFIVDTQKCKKPFILLQWMGMNALIVYILAACELFPAALQGFYWHSPENNLVNATEWLMQILFQSQRWGTLAYVLLEILFWCLLAGLLQLKGIYFKM